MIEVTILENGNLSLYCPEENREDLAYESEQNGYGIALSNGLESYSCNGSFAYLENGDYGLFLGLTDSPFIVESLNIDENGAVIEGRIWWLPNHMVENDMAQLLAGESLVWTLVGE